MRNRSKPVPPKVFPRLLAITSRRYRRAFKCAPTLSKRLGVVSTQPRHKLSLVQAIRAVILRIITLNLSVRLKVKSTGITSLMADYVVPRNPYALRRLLRKVSDSTSSTFPTAARQQTPLAKSLWTTLPVQGAISHIPDRKTPTKNPRISRAQKVRPSFRWLCAGLTKWVRKELTSMPVPELRSRPVKKRKPFLGDRSTRGRS